MAELPTRSGGHGRLGLAGLTLFLTASVAGIGMTVIPTSAPAIETSTLPTDPTLGAALPQTPGDAGSQSSATATPLAPDQATLAQAPPSPDSIGGLAKEPEGPSIGAGPIAPDGGEVAAYPSFAASASSGSDSSAPSTRAGLDVRPAFNVGSLSDGAFGGTAGFSAVPVTPALAARVAASTGLDDTATAGTVTTGTGTSVPGIADGIATAAGGLSGQGGDSNANRPSGSFNPIGPTAPATGASDLGTLATGEAGIGTPGSASATADGTGRAAPADGPVTITALTIPMGGGSSQPPGLDIPFADPGSPACCALNQVVAVSVQVAVPEPGTVALLAAGLGASLVGRRRR